MHVQNHRLSIYMYHSLQTFSFIYNFQKFVVVFNYNPSFHNVVVVDSGGYNSCKTPAGATTYTSGKDHLTLSKGQNFFICNFPGHCEGNMKIAVTAVWFSSCIQDSTMIFTLSMFLRKYIKHPINFASLISYPVFIFLLISIWFNIRRR